MDLPTTVTTVAQVDITAADLLTIAEAHDGNPGPLLLALKSQGTGHVETAVKAAALTAGIDIDNTAGARLATTTHFAGGFGIVAGQSAAPDAVTHTITATATFTGDAVTAINTATPGAFDTVESALVAGVGGDLLGLIESVGFTDDDRALISADVTVDITEGDETAGATP